MGGKVGREEEQLKRPTAYALQFCFCVPPRGACPTWPAFPSAVLFITVNEKVVETITYR